MHLDRAEDPEAPQAYLAAARAQMAEYHYEAAKQLAARGFELAREPADRAALSCLRGDILLDLGETPEALKAFEAALSAATYDAERCRAWIGRAAVKRITDDLDGAFADLERAEAAAVALSSRSKRHACGTFGETSTSRSGTSRAASASTSSAWSWRAKPTPPSWRQRRLVGSATPSTCVRE